MTKENTIKEREAWINSESYHAFDKWWKNEGRFYLEAYHGTKSCLDFMAGDIWRDIEKLLKKKEAL